MTNQELLEGLLRTDRASDVAELLDKYVSSAPAPTSWRPVGDRTNNSGTIQAAGDPGRAIIERITNGIDAAIEKAHLEHHGLPTCASPREAAAAWFGVPAGGLHKLTNQARRRLAQEAVTVSLLPGDGKSQRTVDIADLGGGLTRDQMPNTILSLNAENKIDKFYLIGAFGQGGSATFASSQFTLIASRSAQAPSKVSFTAVKLLPPQGIKLGTYVYLVAGGNVLVADQVPPEMASFSTRIRHYGYDLDDYPSPVGPNSLYGRMQAILFDPVLPFWFENKVHSYSRTIKGARTALNGAKDEEDEESNLSHSCPLFYSDLGEFGQVGIEYWVLEPSTKSAPNRAFVSGTKPIVLTVNGQTHAEWTATYIRRDAELMHLASRMVVHIDCNGLSYDAKRVLFVSNREESRKGVVQNLILQELLSALRTDDRLSQLEEQARLAGTKERDEATEREMRKEVARMLRLFGFAATEDAGARKSQESRDAKNPSAEGKHSRPKPDPIEIVDPPTMLEFVAAEELTFYPSQRRYVRVRTNAHSRYHNASDPSQTRFNFIVNGPHVKVAGSSELREGHMRVIFATDSSAVVGDSGELLAELRPQGSPTISARVRYKIVEPPPAKESTSKINLPNIDCQPVSDIESEEWVSLGWPSEVDEVAADYSFQAAKDTLRIRYSTLFPRYRSTLDELLKKDIATGESFRKRFEIWLIASVLIHWQDSSSDVTSMSSEELEPEKLENFRRDELRRTAKTCALFARRECLSKEPISDFD